MKLKEFVEGVLEQLESEKDISAKEIKFNVGLKQNDDGAIELDFNKSSISFEAKKRTKPAQIDAKF